ncbi:MAG: cell division protein FtsA [Clostridia bacterium]
MAIGDIIVGVDIGTSKTSCIVGQVNKFNEIEVIGYGMSNCDGLKKGKIVDIGAVALSLKESIQKSEDVSSLSINSVYVNAKGMNVRTERVIVETDVTFPDDGINVSDINNINYKAGLIVKLNKNEQIIDILPIKYNLNDKTYKQEPIGSFCKTFEMEADVIIAKSEFTEPLIKTLKLANLKLDGIIIESLATSSVVLMPEEKELGVLMVDIGAGHTDISVFKNNILEFYDTLPVGSNHITNDISITFNISYEEAEKLKKKYNLAIQAMIKEDHEIKLNTVTSADSPNIIKSSDVVRVIEARIKEIYHIIKLSLDEKKLNNKIECMVLTGQGISSIVGVEELAMLILKINQVRICVPKLINIIKPQHTTAFGMVKYVSSLGTSKHVNSEVEIVTEESFKEKVTNTILNTKDKIRNIMSNIKNNDKE